jgi:beta-lactamase regulating signal transducer with metallopeptidase domain
MYSVVVSSSVLILAILLIRKIFFHRVGKCFLYALWLLVAIRLLLPLPGLVLQGTVGWSGPTINTPYSIMNVANKWLPGQKTIQTENYSNRQEEKNNSKIVEKQVETKDGQSTNRINADKMKNKKLQKGNVATTKQKKWLKTANWFQQFYPITVKKIAVSLWLFGMVCLLGVQIQVERKFRRILVENRRKAGTHGPHIYIANGIRTPLLFRSKGIATDIYLPEHIVQRQDLVEHAILHEKVHKRHGDIWWGYLRNFIVAVYWFHPLVWVAAILSKRDCEYACDSGVMKGMNQKERISYGNSLLSLMQIGKGISFFSVATGMSVGKSEIKERIIMVKVGTKKSVLAILAVCIILAEVGVVVFTGADRGAAKTKEKTEKIVASPDINKGDVVAAEEASYQLTDSIGADEPQICYEDEERMIFSGYFGLFVYDRKNCSIVQSLNLKAIDCDSTQGDAYCEIQASADGNTVYLHPYMDKGNMYVYNIKDNTIQKTKFDLDGKKLYKGETESRITSGMGAMIGDLTYQVADGLHFLYQPLFYQPYGVSLNFKPSDICDLQEVSFFFKGKEYKITDAKKLAWMEEHFSNPIKEVVGGSACPFYHPIYLKRKDGKVGRIYVAMDSCAVYKTANGLYYEYAKGSTLTASNKDSFWKLFGLTEDDFFE